MNSNIKTHVRKITYSVLLALLAVALYLSYIGPAIYGPEAGSEKVVIYTTATCPFCKKLRSDLDRLNVPYVERDINDSKAAYLAFVSLGGRGVPLSLIGEEVVYGYRPEKLSSALQRLGYGSH